VKVQHVENMGGFLFFVSGPVQGLMNFSHSVILALRIESAVGEFSLKVQPAHNK
jgi:hypothetical protein